LPSFLTSRGEWLFWWGVTKFTRFQQPFDSIGK
jgi:hypothetical protein